MQKATERLELVLDLAPLDMDLRKQAGEKYLTAGKHQKAIEALENVVDQRPDDAEAHFYLAKAYYKTGRKEHALAQLDRLLALKPKSETAQKTKTNWAAESTLPGWVEGEPFECVGQFEGWCDGLDFTPDGHWLAAGPDKAVMLYDRSYFRPRLLGLHSEHVNDIACEPEGQLLAPGHKDDTVKIWEVETGRCLCTLEGYSGTVN